MAGLKADRETGASVVELALVVSILLLMLFGIVQFGIAFHVYQGIQAASREGARTASIPSSTMDEVTARVQESLSGVDPANESCPPASPGEYCITVTPPSSQPCQNRRGERVTVEVAHLARIDIPLWASQNVTLTGRGVFRCEG